MRKFGLIGYPLSHSFSKKFFTQKFESEGIKDCEYELYPIETIDSLNQLLLDNPDLEGLNVTIPYKLEVLPFLSEIDEAARIIGAVNCIKIAGNGLNVKLRGYNTDAYGFEESLKPLLEPGHQKALVLGDGGAAKAVKYVLNKLNIPFLIVTRSLTFTRSTSTVLECKGFNSFCSTWSAYFEAKSLTGLFTVWTRSRLCECRISRAVGIRESWRRTTE